MIRAGIAHPLCATLVILLAAPSGFSQVPPAATPAAPPAAVPKMPGTPLTISILEGSNAVNSIPLLHSVAAVVEIHDANDFPVEDASVTFTLPAQGPGGTFVLGGKTFSTRSDARGQATAPVIVPSGAGKFRIAVTAAAGDRKGEVFVDQTNSERAYVGPVAPRAWYKRRLVWAIAGGAVAAIVVVIVLHETSSNTIIVTLGTPVITP